MATHNTYILLPFHFSFISPAVPIFKFFKKLLKKVRPAGPLEKGKSQKFVGMWDWILAEFKLKMNPTAEAHATQNKLFY
jgi:hypothetical protein